MRCARSTVLTVQPQRILSSRDAAAAFRPGYNSAYCSSACPELAQSDSRVQPLRQSPTFQVRCDSMQNVRVHFIRLGVRMPNAKRMVNSNPPMDCVIAPAERMACAYLWSCCARDQVNNSSKSAAPTGLIRYRSIPASRASSRPGCALLAVNAISLRFCSCGC